MAEPMAEEFVTLAEVARRTGLPPRTLHNRLRRYGVALWTDPSDERKRLVRTEDAALLVTPRRVTPRTQEAAA